MIVFKNSDQQITKNFNSNEMDCKCDNCIETLINLDHMMKLQKLRNLIDKPIKINSGYRCKAHNKEVGGTKHSQHLYGIATDIVVKNFSIKELHEACVKLDFNGIGLYDKFIHVDSRSGPKSRWDFRMSGKNIELG